MERGLEALAKTNKERFAQLSKKQEEEAEIAANSLRIIDHKLNELSRSTVEPLKIILHSTNMQAAVTQPQLAAVSRMKGEIEVRGEQNRELERCMEDLRSQLE